MDESETLFLVLLMFSFASLGVVASFHILSFYPEGVDSGIFDYQTDDTWDHYEINVAKTSWQFPTWVVIYSLQLLWLIYAMVALCRETKKGSLIMNPPILPSSIFFTFILALAGTMGWIFLWDMRDYYIWYSAICCLATTIFMTFTVAISLHATNLYQDEVIEQGFSVDVWMIRSVVQNAMGAYAAYASVETTYTAGLILYETELVSVDASDYIVLGVLMVYVIIFSTVDLMVGQQLTCLMLSPYVIFILSFIQPFIDYYDNDENDMIFVLSAVFLGITGLMLVAKLAIMAARCFCERKMLKEEKASIQEEFGAVKYDDDGTGIIDHQGVSPTPSGSGEYYQHESPTPSGSGAYDQHESPTPDPSVNFYQNENYMQDNEIDEILADHLRY